MNAEINKDFIFNYLAGKSTALQKQWLDEWVKEPAHEELFYQWLVEYEYQQPQYLTDSDSGIARFRLYAEQAFQNEPVEAPLQASYLARDWLWRGLMAASIAVILLAGGWFFLDAVLYKTHQSAYGETRNLLLDDSTRVVLNANSSLRVPRFGFGQGSREVLLSGEANFDVAHRPDNQKFIVKTEKGFEVVVLGTEFTVYARATRSKVVLNKGKVQLNYRQGQTHKQVLMKPGDLVMLDEGNRLRQEVTPQPENHAAWKDHRFVFDDTTLAEFAGIVEESYGIKVVIPDEQLASRTLVGSFRAESSEELLEIVCRIFNLKSVRTGDVVTLVGD